MYDVNFGIISQEFKIINMEEIDTKQEQMGCVSREVEMLRQVSKANTGNKHE